MPRPDDNTSEEINPRWQLVNLLPLWILQALTYWFISFVPFFCFVKCPPPPLKGISIALGVASCAAIAIEAWFFARRALSPPNDLDFQTAKCIIVAGLWVAVFVRFGGGDMILLVVLVYTAFTLPFSLHLLYALVHSLSYVDQGEGDRVREQGNEAETAPLDGGNDSNYGSAEQRQGEAEMPLENELIWPPGRKLWPNWILQLINLLFLFVLRTVGWMAFPPSHNFGDVFTFVAAAISVLLTCCEVFFACRKNGRKLSLQAYLGVQLVKLGILYFILVLIVLAHGGWRPEAGILAKSIFGVFVLSILFGSPFIAECVFAAAEYKKRRQRALEIHDEIGGGDDASSGRILS